MDKIRLKGMESEEYFREFYYINYKGDNNIEQISGHKHEFYELLLYIYGSVDFKVEDFTYALQYGDIIVIPPNVMHKANIQTEKGSYRRYVLWLTEDFIKSLVEFDDSMRYLFETMRKKETYRIQIPQKDINHLIYILAEVMEKQQTMEFGYQTKCKSMLYDLFYEINSTLYQEDHYAFQLQKKDTYLEIADFIKNNLNEDLSLDTLANQFFMSKYHMLHVFKEKMNISIHKYIVIRRLELAKVLILSGEAISKVHESCGFKDYVTFYRAFRKRYGMAPAAYYEKYSQC